MQSTIFKEISLEGCGIPASAIPGACLIYGNDKERIRQKWKISRYGPPALKMPQKY